MRSGAWDHTRITEALEGRLDTTQLSEAEEIVWLGAIAERMAQTSEAEETFYAERQAPGRDVGLDAGGNLIHAGDDTAS